jgi:hypothetical protein
MLTMRDAISNAHSLVKAKLATIRLQLLKLGARVIETVARARLALAAAGQWADRRPLLRASDDAGVYSRRKNLSRARP